MIEKAIGLGAATGVWTAALVAFPPVLAGATVVRVLSAPAMARFAAQLAAAAEDPLPGEYARADA